DVPEAFAPHLGLGDLDPAAVADHSAVADALVLAAVALPVLDRAEDLLAEQAVLLGLERPVVDGLGLRHLAMRPAPDDVRCGESDADRVEHHAAALLAVFGSPEAELARRQVQRRLEFSFLNHSVLLCKAQHATLTLPRTELPDTGSGAP